MVPQLKRLILHTLHRFGYVVLKGTDYERLIAVPSASKIEEMRRINPTGVADLPDPTISITPREMPASAEFLAAIDGACESSRAAALYAVAHYLVEANIEGDVLDCGFGATETLIALAAALQRLGDTSRNLVLFDTTADPLHRAEAQLPLWGTERDLLAKTRIVAQSGRSEPAPAELRSTGYPTEKMSINRYPREPIAAFGKLAFLGLTAQTFPSNRDAIATFLPQLSRGGVIAVAADPFGLSQGDPIEEILKVQNSAVLFFKIADNFRIGVKP